MGDGTANIHFGKCDGIDLDEEGAYGKASEQMTDHMYDLAMDLHGAEGDKKISYVDLGSGTGAAPCGCARNTTPSRRQLASTCATSANTQFHEVLAKFSCFATRATCKT